MTPSKELCDKQQEDDSQRDKEGGSSSPASPSGREEPIPKNGQSDKAYSPHIPGRVLYVYRWGAADNFQWTPDTIVHDRFQPFDMLACMYFCQLVTASCLVEPAKPGLLAMARLCLKTASIAGRRVMRNARKSMSWHMSSSHALLCAACASLTRSSRIIS